MMVGLQQQQRPRCLLYSFLLLLLLLLHHYQQAASFVIHQPSLPSLAARRGRTCCHAQQQLQRRGPLEPAPIYRDFEGGPVDELLYTFFRRKVVQQLGGKDTEEPGFQGLIALIRRLDVAFSSKQETNKAAQNILRSLFPSWLPGAFAILFAKPLPGLSGKMNAYITKLTTFWLMGESELVDVEIDGGKMGKGHGLLIKRCRYLEEAKCASVCINTCRIPTQNFFNADMGLPLTMTPDFDTFECEFAFGKTPPKFSAEDEVLPVACFGQCPTASKKQASCYGIEA